LDFSRGLGVAKNSGKIEGKKSLGALENEPYLFFGETMLLGLLKVHCSMQIFPKNLYSQKIFRIFQSFKSYRNQHSHVQYKKKKTVKKKQLTLTSSILNACFQQGKKLELFQAPYNMAKPFVTEGGLMQGKPTQVGAVENNALNLVPNFVIE
jgi:hypothetical protein